MYCQESKLFFFVLYLRAAVIWLKYCRNGVKSQTINISEWDVPNEPILKTLEVGPLFYLRGTSPPTQYVKTLEVDPLGQQPTTSIPSAAALGNISACAKPNVTNGKTTNCDVIPISIPIGRLMCFHKGSISVALPIPNMMVTSVTLMTTSNTSFRGDGPLGGAMPVMFVSIVELGDSIMTAAMFGLISDLDFICKGKCILIVPFKNSFFNFEAHITENYNM